MLICPPGRVRSVRTVAPLSPPRGTGTLRFAICSKPVPAQVSEQIKGPGIQRVPSSQGHQVPAARWTQPAWVPKVGAPGRSGSGRRQPEESGHRQSPSERHRAPGVRQVPVWTELCRPLLPRSRDSMTCPFPLHRRTCSQSCPSQTARSSPSTLPCPWRTPQRIMPGN